MTTGYLWDEIFGWHDTGSGTLFPADPDLGHQPISHHVAHPDTKRRMHELICVSGLVDHLTRIAPRTASVEELTRVHTPEHVERIVRESAQPKGGDAGDGISPFGKGAYRIAALGAGSAIAMTEAVVAGTVDNGYALVNPAGHHALPETGLGFCIFNNVAIAAKHAQAVLGIERIAIVDWDVHHGNGAQAIFAEDPSVLTISLHQDRCFPPNSGLVEERGTAAGEHYNVNIPMPVGCGDGAYQYAARTVIGPALEAFAPELIIVASGFDPNAMDPLARQLVTTRGFITLTETVMEAAARSAGGRLVLVQEGGYSPVYVPFCGLATIETLAGVHVMDDGLLPVVGGMGGHDLEPHQKELVDRVAAFVGDIARA
ncbi:class II histone deacetylase [Pseudonocardia broussonetiae]|uniref:Class II histone deacetylase n=1 Tax=Pseudonocardia broussonetiae TaxID=2736640 RepID=A0A6M6JM56_9PSEU|nr:class II histone deacetylase [Pseudonocardia broussonetiae]QJY47499.1 class II histone deacetylase [Pseudonocardia broussonetiae]